MRFEIAPDDPAIRWTGLAGLERTGDDRWRAWRLPPDELRFAHAPELTWTASMPAGVVATFRTAATRLDLAIERDPAETPLDVLVDGELVHRGLPPVALPGRDRVVQVWFPQYGATTFGVFGLDAPVTPAPAADRPRWVTYGSSISQCRAAAGPSETWPALVAREHDWELRCLGFGGQCHLDPVAIRAIRDAPADLISLCLGINVYGTASLTRRTFPGMVSGAIHTIREGHPDTPIAVLTPIASPSRERIRNAAGFTLAEIRDEVTAAVRLRQEAGDDGLHLIDGPDLLGVADAGLLHDGLHPSADGYRHLARLLSPRLGALLRTATRAPAATA